MKIEVKTKFESLSSYGAVEIIAELMSSSIFNETDLFKKENFFFVLHTKIKTTL